MVWRQTVIGWDGQMVAFAVEGVDGGAVAAQACYGMGQDGQRVRVDVLPGNLCPQYK